MAVRFNKAIPLTPDDVIIRYKNDEILGVNVVSVFVAVVGVIFASCKTLLIFLLPALTLSLREKNVGENVMWI